MFLSIGMLKQKYFLTDIFILSAEKQPIKLSWRKIECLLQTISEKYPYFVYETEGQIAGYCYVHGWKEKAAYNQSAETTIYLAPSHTGKGIGKELMLHLIEECRRYGLHALIACITEGNEASYALHEKLGFEKVSYFREVGRKFGKWLGIVDYELIL